MHAFIYTCTCLYTCTCTLAPSSLWNPTRYLHVHVHVHVCTWKFTCIHVYILVPIPNLHVRGNHHTRKALTCTVQPRLSEPRLSEFEMQRKFRVKVHIVITWLDCTCAVNLRRVIATREPAAALLSNLVLTLKEVEETHGKRSINRGWD